MSRSPPEVMESLGMVGLSPARVASDYGKLDLDPTAARKIYREFAGDTAPEVSDRLVVTTVSYMLFDTASGKALDVADAIDRAERLAARMPWAYTESAAAERAALRAATREVKKVAVEAAAAERAAVPVDPDAPVVIKRGRKPAGVKSIYSQVADLWNAAADRSKEGFIKHLQDTLSLGFGTAQTYYYKAKKELGEAVAA